MSYGKSESRSGAFASATDAHNVAAPVSSYLTKSRAPRQIVPRHWRSILVPPLALHRKCPC